MWFSLLLFLVTTVSGSTFYVRVNGTDSGLCGGVNSPCLSIRQSITNSKAGDVISIGSGTYTGNNNVNVTINGRYLKNADAQFPTLDCLQTRVYGFVVDNSVNTTNVNGLRIVNCASGGITTTSSSVNVGNCSFTGNNGAVLVNGGYMTMQDCTIQNNTGFNKGAIQVKRILFC